eukprot:g29438.t1
MFNLNVKQVELLSAQLISAINAAQQGAEEIVAASKKQREETVAAVKQEREEWKGEKKRITAIHRFGDEKVVLDVGGQRFATYLHVLQSPLARETLLGALFSGRHKLETNPEPVFIDRDPFVFRYILNFLRSPQTCTFPRDPAQQEELFREAQYYCMPHEFFCSCNESGKSCMGEEVYRGWKADDIFVANSSHTPSTGNVLKLLDDTTPDILAFDKKSSGSIFFNKALPFTALELNHGAGMSFDVQVLEKGQWKTLASTTLTSDSWSSRITWAPRKARPEGWKLVLTNNTSTRYLRGFRWYAIAFFQLIRPWCEQFRETVPQKKEQQQQEEPEQTQGQEQTQGLVEPQHKKRKREQENQ